MKLDSDQERFVNHDKGHALVLAGAGAGKTHSIIQRTVRLIEKGIPANRILLMTFTNKACAEMRERIREAGCEIPDVLTYHKFGSRLIRENHEVMGLRPNPSIMDAKDARARQISLFKDMNFSQDTMKCYREMISFIACEGLDPAMKEDRPDILSALKQYGMTDHQEYEIFVNVALIYGDLKRQDNVLDYDDLLMLPMRAMRNDESFRLTVQEKYWYFCIDESQDGNTCQYKLVKLINCPNVAMIGDQKQSLYRFRGARPDNLLLFVEEFNPTLYHLVRNYRSVPVIVNSATCVIKNNASTLEKDSYAVREDPGNKIKYSVFNRDYQMAESIAKIIKNDLDKGVDPNNIAILYRMNKMAKTLEPAFLKYQIPYSIKKGTELLERAEVKLLIAAGRLLLNPSDIQALSRFSKLIPGLGTKSIQKLAEITRANKNGIWENLAVLNSKSKAALEYLYASMMELKKKGPAHLIPWALEETSFKIWMQNEAHKTAKNCKSNDIEKAAQSILDSRINNLKVLHVAIQARLENNNIANLDDLWADIVIDLVPTPPDEAEQTHCVTLSTVHSAKGLQWETVHVAGFSDGLIPLRNSETHVVENLQEERCIAYVAMTRAKDSLFLHHCEGSVINGQFQSFETSRFLQEFANDDVLDYEQDKSIIQSSKNMRRLNNHSADAAILF